VFERDIDTLLKKICVDIDEVSADKLKEIGGRLVELYRQRLVKINHSVMELICVKPLILRGYDVDIEHPLESSLICDIYAKKGEGVLMIEIETGFTPPEHALDPYTYNEARVASKIARYSAYSNKFALATPSYSILLIPDIFSRPPRHRGEDEIREVEKLCNTYYSKPPITAEQIRKARLQSIYIIDVDRAKVREIDPEAYQELVLNLRSLLPT